MRQAVSDRRSAASSGMLYVSAAVAVSVLLHAGAVGWWLFRPVALPEVSGAPTVTVDLISLAPPGEQPPAPAPPPVAQPEPEMLKDDEMAIQRKVVKKKPEKKPQEPVRQDKPQTDSQAAPTEQKSDAPPASAPVTAARFDANYLNHPASYPQLSRRMGEEGRVVLRVEVSADGKPLSIVLKQSSGFARLDEAAMKAVAKWQFSPARQGDRAVASKVEVPIQFRLEK